MQLKVVWLKMGFPFHEIKVKVNKSMQNNLNNMPPTTYKNYK